MNERLTVDSGMKKPKHQGEKTLGHYAYPRSFQQDQTEARCPLQQLHTFSLSLANYNNDLIMVLANQIQLCLGKAGSH